MGADLGRCYIEALKNIDSVRNCSGDVMDNINSVLLSLSSNVGASPQWTWVAEEEKKLRKMVEGKTIADQHFRQKEYRQAHEKYSDVLKVRSKLEVILTI